MTDSHPDLDELRALVDDVDDAIAALREYGDDHDIPAIERDAKRMQGTLSTVRQNVPGGLTDDH